ncbi:MAG: hypothetical protein J6Q84_02250 [Kiritimatiellae bacterium]|jgi:hypothetical protein|nr:hypothetical protein [Kiritimatiellia bacterium]
MKIKKQMTVKPPMGNSAGGATIADRFKLEPMADNRSSSSDANTASTKLAVAAAVIALAVLGGLVWFLYMYNDYMVGEIAN